MELSKGTSGSAKTGLQEDTNSSTPPGRRSVFSTAGGEGEASYARNSRHQALLGTYLQPFLKQSLLDLVLPSARPIHVADFGCSVGANTITYAQLIAESLKANPAYSGQDIFHFFSDLPSNDFNTLFNQLPPFVGQGGGREERTWFAAGVPGSQFDAVFPGASLRVVISTFALFYLSEIPKAVLDKSSPSYNKGRIWIQDSNPVVAEAYAEASRACIRTFFERRAHELAPGGLLAVLVACRKHRNHPEKQFPDDNISPFSELEEAFEELVREGAMAAELRDSFNLPLCYPSEEELREAIESTSSFRIQKLQIYEKVRVFPDDSILFKDAESYSKLSENMARSSVSSMVEAHFGPQLAHKFFERLGQIYKRAYPSLKAHYDHLPLFLTFCIAILIRK